MRTHRICIAGMVMAVMVLALAGSGAATSHTIAAGDTFELTLDYTADPLNPSSVSWYTMSGANLHFTVEDPSGSLVYELASSSAGAYSPDFLTGAEGEYTYRWENDGSTSVNLQYTVFGFEEIQNAIDTFVLAAIIGGVVIVVIIIVVVLLVVMGGKKKAAMAPQATMPMGPPIMDGKCVRCGTPVDPAGTWCPKCGAPLK